MIKQILVVISIIIIFAGCTTKPQTPVQNSSSIEGAMLGEADSLIQIKSV